MKKFCFASLLAAVPAVATMAAAQQIEGRFGFEYNEFGNHPENELLLSKLSKIVDQGDVNVNVLAGGCAEKIIAAAPTQQDGTASKKC